MPLLFPVAAASLGTLFMLEKFMLYYVYQAPPAYDEKLNNSVLNVMAFAPLFLLSFGYWILTNHQLIENDNLRPLEHSKDVFQANHIWYAAFTPEGVEESGPAVALLVLFLIYLGQILFSKPILSIWYFIIKMFNSDRCTASCAPGLLVEELELDEEIEVYQKCLDRDDRRWTLEEEKNMNKYGMQTMLDETKKDLTEN